MSPDRKNHFLTAVALGLAVALSNGTSHAEVICDSPCDTTALEPEPRNPTRDRDSLILATIAGVAFIAPLAVYIGTRKNAEAEY